MCVAHCAGVTVLFIVVIICLKKVLNGLCWDDDHTIAQWLEHRWLQARSLVRVLGVKVNFSSDFSRLCLSLKPVNMLLLLFLITAISSTSWIDICVHFIHVM